MLSRSSLYTLISILSIAVFVGIVLYGNSQKKELSQAIDGNEILGMMGETSTSTSSGSLVEQIAEGGSEQAKNIAIQKASEIKTSLVDYLKKEATRLTEAQVKQLTTQLCTDWGVLPSPTP